MKCVAKTSCLFVQYHPYNVCLFVIYVIQSVCIMNKVILMSRNFPHCECLSIESILGSIENLVMNKGNISIQLLTFFAWRCIITIEK